MTKVQTHKEDINRWSPSIFMIIGVTLNIIFCSIFSILLFTIPLTIPAIVLNALLLAPRVDTKRYHAYWKYIPVIIVFSLTTILVILFSLTVSSMEDLYNGFSDFLNTLVFWKREAIIPMEVNADPIKDVIEITLMVLGYSGSTFIIIGWYKKKKIGEIEVETKQSKEPKSKKDKKVKKDK